jgi:hypothetical protein
MKDMTGENECAAVRESEMWMKKGNGFAENMVINAQK